MGHHSKIIGTFLFLLMVYVVPGIAEESPRTRIERTVTREFSGFTDPQIITNTQKGEVIFKTWNEDKILIVITITSEADNKSDAQNGLDLVHIVTNRTGDQVFLETQFPDQVNNSLIWDLIYFWQDDPKLSVDLVINVPVTTEYDLTHQYGDLILPNINAGKVDIKYGSFNCGAVSNQIGLVAAYSKGSISDLNRGNIELQYSDFAFGNVLTGKVNTEYSKFRCVDSKKLEINSKYSSVTIGAVDDLIMEGKFDKLDIEAVMDGQINTRYTAINIGKVSSSLDVVNSYQSTKIHNIMPGFQGIEVVGKYGNCVLEFQGRLDANFVLETKYGNIQIPDNARIIEKNVDEFTKSITGQLGQGGEKIYVVNSYGNITLQYQ